MKLTNLTSKLLDEEWRIHTDLFGQNKFLLFPIQVAIILTIGFALLNRISLSQHLLETSLLTLSFLVGLQTGTVGFITQEALEDMVGRFTSIIFTARTHPISERKTMIAFVIKDFIFYTFLFLLPLTIGFTLGTNANILQTGFTVISFYLLGAGITLNLSTLNKRNLSIFILLAIGVTYGLLQQPITIDSKFALISGLVLTLISFTFFKLESQETTQTSLIKKHLPKLRAEHLPFNHTENALTVKSLRDIQRSTGGLLKLPLVGGIIVGLLLSVALFITQGTAFTLNSFYLISTLLATPTILVYYWLFQADSFDKYKIHPFTKQEIYRGKRNAFTLILLGEILFVILLGTILNSTYLQIMSGGFVFTMVSLYLWGVLTKLTGFEPDSKLFDSKAYSKLTILVMIGMGPFLTLGFIVSIAEPAFLFYVITLGWGWVIGGVGIYLSSRTKFSF